MTARVTVASPILKGPPVAADSAAQHDQALFWSAHVFHIGNAATGDKRRFQLRLGRVRADAHQCLPARYILRRRTRWIWSVHGISLLNWLEVFMTSQPASLASELDIARPARREQPQCDANYIALYRCRTVMKL